MRLGWLTGHGSAEFLRDLEIVVNAFPPETQRQIKFLGVFVSAERPKDDNGDDLLGVRGAEGPIILYQNSFTPHHHGAIERTLLGCMLGKPGDWRKTVEPLAKFPVHE